MNGFEIGWKRECDDADEVLRHIGLDPAQCRTDGGWLNVKRIKTLLSEKGAAAAQADAHELWAAAQLAPGEGIEAGVARIESLLAAPPAAPESAAAAQPVAFISRESMARLQRGGNDSKGTVPVHARHSSVSNIALYATPPAAPMADAYAGAREDAAIWKKRALECEETCRHLAAALAQEVNGPTFMGEPVTPPAAPEPAGPNDMAVYQAIADNYHAPLTAAPEPLTFDEIEALRKEHTYPGNGEASFNTLLFARAIERAHGIGTQERK